MSAKAVLDACAPIILALDAYAFTIGDAAVRIHRSVTRPTVYTPHSEQEAKRIAERASSMFEHNVRELSVRIAVAETLTADGWDGRELAVTLRLAIAVLDAARSGACSGDDAGCAARALSFAMKAGRRSTIAEEVAA